MSRSAFPTSLKPITLQHVPARAGLAAVLLSLLAAPAGAQAGAPDIITFDNLPLPPALNQNYELQVANNGSLVWDGVTFSEGWGITGFQTGDRGDGIPLLDTHSGDYAVVFDYGHTQSIQTSKPLYGFWAGTVQYSAPGPVIQAVQVEALDSSGAVLGTVEGVFDTKDPQYIDTSALAGLTGVAGYSFAPDPQGQNIYGGFNQFSLDDLTFSPSQTNPVPEASTTLSFGLLLALGLGGFAAKKQRKGCAAAQQP